MKRHEAQAFRQKIERAASLTDDATALEMVELFPLWASGEAVSVGDRKQYNGTLYKCLQAHTTSAQWTPDLTPALWAVVSVEEWPEWVQPLGASDAYDAGDKVTHNNLRWTSSCDANVWEPGVYGWVQAV